MKTPNTAASRELFDETSLNLSRMRCCIFWTGTPHVNHEGTDHHHGDGAENCFAQSLIPKELANVAADKLAKNALNGRVINALVEDVGESAAGGAGS